MHLKILLALLILISGYFIGVYLPFNMRPEIQYKPITTGEFYYYSITTLTAIATWLTIVVALFKEEIIRLFKHVKLTSHFMQEQTLHEDLEDIQGNKKAKKYYSVSIIENKGNISADNCELYIDQIAYRSENHNTILLAESKQIEWPLNKLRIYIPPSGKCPIHLFELHKPQKTSTPDGAKDDIPAILKIIGHQDIKVENKGEWICKYSFHSSTMSTPMRFEVVINWNGLWEHRLSEMNNNLKVQFKIL